MLLTILNNLNETRELLIDICDLNDRSALCREAGFLYRFFEYNEEQDLTNIELSLDEMKELGDERLLSLYEYGFTINGSGSDRTPASKEVLFIECKDEEDSIGFALNKALPKLSKNRLNILIMFFEDADSAVYSSNLYSIVEDFRSVTKDYNIKLYTFDMLNEVTMDSYAIKCLGHNGYTNIKSIYYPVCNNNDLLEFESKVIESGRYFVPTSVSDSFVDKDIWILAYVAMRKSAVIVFEDGKYDGLYNAICQKLFSHEWSMLSDIIKHINSLEGNTYIIQTDSGKYKPCTVTKVDKQFEFSVIYLKDIYNDVPEPVLRHTIKKKDIIIQPNDILDSVSVMQKLWSMSGQDVSRYLKLLSRIQHICLYCLTDRLIGINQVCWILDNGEICFGVPAIDYNNVEVCVYTGTDTRTMSANQARLLPTCLFSDEFLGAIIQGAGKCSIRQISYDAILNIDRLNLSGSSDFTLYMNEGKIYEAFTLLNYPISASEQELYRRCLKIFGKEFCDKINVELDGKLGDSVNLSSIL